jgi:hypothetical protein
MSGHIYQCFGEGKGGQTQFIRTTEVLGQYIAKYVKYPADMTCLTRELKQPSITRPLDLTSSASEFEKLQWKQEVEDYFKRNRQLQHNTKTVYSVIWGQCSEALRARLKSHPDFDVNDTSQNCEWLLKTIKGIMIRFESQRFVFLSMADATQQVFTFRQGPDMALSKYYEDFKNLIEVYEHYGGDLGSSPVLVATITTGTPAQKQLAARNMYIGILFLRGADRKRFGGLWTDLENQHSRGLNQYPKDLTDAYALLLNYKTLKSAPAATTSSQSSSGTSTPVSSSTLSDHTGMSFAQSSIVETPGTDGTLHAKITCHKCRLKGHYANKCPSTGNVFAESPKFTHSPSQPSLPPSHLGHSCSHVRHLSSIPTSWVLLDSQSTDSIFNNASLLANIRESPTSLTLLTNGGHITSTQIGDYSCFGAVWYNPASIANILSLAHARRICRITMDSAQDTSIILHHPSGPIQRFQEYSNGLYFYDTNPNLKQRNLPLSLPASSLVQTVQDTKSQFHRREVLAADTARSLRRRLGHISQSHFEHMLTHNSIRNCPVTLDDARRAIVIYGDDTASLAGKTVASAPVQVPSLVINPAATQCALAHSNIVLSIDIFYVQGCMFFHTISRHIKFRTVSPIPDRKLSTLQTELRSVLTLYSGRGFTVSSVHADLEFACLQPSLLPLPMNLVPRDAHVGEIERSIRTIKERVRADVSTLPFSRLPKLLICELVRRAVHFLNHCPTLDDVSATLSPSSVVTGASPP